MPFARRSTLGRPMDLAHRFGVPASTSAHCCTHIRTALQSDGLSCLLVYGAPDVPDSFCIDRSEDLAVFRARVRCA